MTLPGCGGLEAGGQAGAFSFSEAGTGWASGQASWLCSVQAAQGGWRSAGQSRALPAPGHVETAP